jgi:hypothetical protein
MGNICLAAHSGKKHEWQHILGKNMIGSIFWGKPRLSAHSGKKKHDWQHILEKT